MLAVEKPGLENTLTGLPTDDLESEKERIRDSIELMAVLFEVEPEEYQDKIPELTTDENFSTAAYDALENKFIFNPKYLGDLGVIAEEVTHFLRCLYYNHKDKDIKDSYGHVHEFFGGLGRALVTGEKVALDKEHLKKVHEKVKAAESKIDERVDSCFQKIDRLIDAYDNSILRYEAKIEEIEPLCEPSINYNTLLAGLKNVPEDNTLKKILQYTEDNPNLPEYELTSMCYAKLNEYLAILQFNLTQNRFKKDELIMKKHNLNLDTDILKVNNSFRHMNDTIHEVGYAGAQGVIDELGLSILEKHPDLIRKSDKEVEEILYQYI